MSEIIETQIEQQVKSKERIKDFGEVFTNPREVNAMLDLVKDESYKVDSRFLEPACGNGNFLVEILRRKLETAYKEVYKVDQENIEKQVFIAVGSIYGIDIQKDNCEESIERMYEIILDKYAEVYLDSQDEEFLKAIKFVLELNIIHGNGLDGKQELTGKPILFSEWIFKEESYEVIRRDFSMNEMIAHEKIIAENEKKKNPESQSLFSLDIGAIKAPKEELKPQKEFDPIYFKNVYKVSD